MNHKLTYLRRWVTDFKVLVSDDISAEQMRIVKGSQWLRVGIRSGGQTIFAEPVSGDLTSIRVECKLSIVTRSVQWSTNCHIEQTESTKGPNS